MSPTTILTNTGRLIRTEGLPEAARSLYRRALVRYHERRLGVNTEAVLSVDELGFASAECRFYAAVDYRFSRILRGLRLPWREHTFLDMGCGMGRAVFIAGGLPFRRVIGMDLSEPLIAQARENLKRAARKMRCQVELEQADATTYAIAPDVSAIFICNSFNGSILWRVLDNIRASVQAHPRTVTLIFALPPESACERDLARYGGMLRHGRVERLERTRFVMYEVG